jgi:hypothetical protein
VDPIVDPLAHYEKIKAASGGNIEKRLFLCAQIFFTPEITEKDICAALLK